MQSRNTIRYSAPIQKRSETRYRSVLGPDSDVVHRFVPPTPPTLARCEAAKEDPNYKTNFYSVKRLATMKPNEKRYIVNGIIHNQTHGKFPSRGPISDGMYHYRLKALVAMFFPGEYAEVTKKVVEVDLEKTTDAELEIITSYLWAFIYARLGDNTNAIIAFAKADELFGAYRHAAWLGRQ
jgi:hypothetical protein